MDKLKRELLEEFEQGLENICNSSANESEEVLKKLDVISERLASLEIRLSMLETARTATYPTSYPHNQPPWGIPPAITYGTI